MLLISSHIISVCCQQTSMTQQGELSSEQINFFDDSTFEKIKTERLNAFEEGISLHSFNFFQENLSSAGDFAAAHNVQFIVVGTAITQAEKNEPTGGRILVFAVDEDKVLYSYCSNYLYIF